MTLGFCLVHWWQQILSKCLRKSEKTDILSFKFIFIWRKCIDWRSLLAPSAVSILRSEVLSYNKRNYFSYVQHPIIVGNPWQGKSHAVPLNLSKLYCGFMLQKEKMQICVVTYKFVCVAFCPVPIAKNNFLKLRSGNAKWNTIKIQMVLTVTFHLEKWLMCLFFWTLLIICVVTRGKWILLRRKAVLFDHLYNVGFSDFSMEAEWLQEQPETSGP